MLVASQPIETLLFSLRVHFLEIGVGIQEPLGIIILNEMPLAVQQYKFWGFYFL